MSALGRKVTVDEADGAAIERRLHRVGRFVRLARVCNRHRWRTFLVWLLALVVIQVIASSVGVKQISNFRLPGTESQRAYDQLA